MPVYQSYRVDFRIWILIGQELVWPYAMPKSRRLMFCGRETMNVAVQYVKRLIVLLCKIVYLMSFWQEYGLSMVYHQIRIQLEDSMNKAWAAPNFSMRCSVYY
jgi:hypothetical protein